MTEHGPVWTGQVRVVPDALEEPLKWRKSQKVFVNSMSDLFHESVPDDFLDRVFAVMALAKEHTFQILTKRPGRMLTYLAGDFVSKLAGWACAAVRFDAWKAPTICEAAWPLSNVWLGVSVENQATADERIPILLQTPAAVRFLSVEPLLGAIDLSCVELPAKYNLSPSCPGRIDALRADNEDRFYTGHRTIDWVIVGGESGPAARPCNIDWIRDIVRQCKAASISVFVKQIGSHPIHLPNAVTDGPYHVRDRKGGDPDEWPGDLRVREYPRTTR